MHYVLIILFINLSSNTVGSSVSADFDSRERCMDALSMLTEGRNDTIAGCFVK